MSSNDAHIRQKIDDILGWTKNQTYVSSSLIQESFGINERLASNYIKLLQSNEAISLFMEDGAFPVLANADSLAEPCSYALLEEKLMTRTRKTALIVFFDSKEEMVELPETIPHYSLVLRDLFFEEVPLNAREWFAEAPSLAEFIDKYYQESYRFLVVCGAGVSRSAAVAAAILEFYEDEGLCVFSDFRYSPNKVIYKVLLEAMKERKFKAHETRQK